MDQTHLFLKKKLIQPKIATVLSIPSTWLQRQNLCRQVVSTGLNDLHIPIDTREHLFSIESNDARISDFEKTHMLDSLHVFTLDTIEKASIANSRNSIHYMQFLKNRQL